MRLTGFGGNFENLFEHSTGEDRHMSPSSCKLSTVQGLENDFGQCRRIELIFISTTVRPLITCFFGTKKNRKLWEDRQVMGDVL